MKKKGIIHICSYGAAKALSHLEGEQQGRIFQGRPKEPKDNAGNLKRAEAKREKRRAKRLANMKKQGKL